MNKNQHQRKTESIYPNIDQSEIDRKWRVYVEEQERLMILESAARMADADAAGGAAGGGGGTLVDGTTTTTTTTIAPTTTTSTTTTSSTTTTTTAGPTGSVKFLVLGDASSAANASQIYSEIVSLGYGATGASVVIGTTYTGATAGITPSNYDVVIYQTNSAQTGATGLNATLRSYVNAGGHLITTTFAWNLRPTGFDYTLTPWVGPVGQSNNSTGNMTKTITHPITDGVNTSLTGGVIILNNTVTTLQSGATLVATYTTGGSPLVAINTVGSSRLVGLNLYWSGGLSAYTNIRRMVANSVLWASGRIS